MSTAQGCPCGHDCCKEPEVYTPEFECDCKPEDCYCSENYRLVCQNCGASCYCEE